VSDVGVAASPVYPAGTPAPPRGAPRLDARAVIARPKWPETVLQFGEGNFLRAFVDWMLERMNAQGLFQGRAVLVQPIPSGMAALLNEQNGLYTVLLRGLVDGRAVDTRELVSSVSRCIDPHASWDAYIACAANPRLRFVVSNTTEAGIRVEPDDALDARPARSFPAKLTQLLHARFLRFEGDRARGLVMLPCELIERNGDALRRAVGALATRWRLGDAFLTWLDESCVFTNTLVDRIVTGYPTDGPDALAASLGYDDRLAVAAEPFHAWVIEGPRALEDELPLGKAGLAVTFTSDLRPYRDRKVRILNGAHTMTALAAFLAGHDTVRGFMDDDLIRGYMDRGISDEILPTLLLPPPESTTRALPRAELESFAAAVVERFRNPFIEHGLLSISLNSLSKYRARILPTVMDFIGMGDSPPPRLSFALAALCAFYRGREVEDGTLFGLRDGRRYPIRDDAAVLDFFLEAWAEVGDRPTALGCLKLVRRLLARADFWDHDLDARLPGFAEAVAQHLNDIHVLGIRGALRQVA